MSFGTYDLELKESVEFLTNNTNTVLFDEEENIPSIMVKINKGYSRDVLEGGILKSTDSRNAVTQIIDRVHPAFKVGEVQVETVYVSKYPNIIYNGKPYSLPLKGPTNKWTYSISQLETLCKAKGENWGLMPNSLWAYIALLTKKLRTNIGGNTAFGKNEEYPSEYGYITDTDLTDQYYGRTMYGSGNLSWSHDNTLNGIFDLCGNQPEKVSGFRIYGGEIQVIPFANTILDYTSADWKALQSVSTGDAYTAPTATTTFATSNTARYNTTSQSPFALAVDMGQNEFVRRTTSSGSTIEFEAIEQMKDSNAIIIPQECYELLICPQAGVSYNNDVFSGICTAENYVAVPKRGGSHRDRLKSGLFNVNFINSNTTDSNLRCFRSVYYDI